MERARQAFQSPWRRLLAGLALAGVIAVVVVFLILPGSAAGVPPSCNDRPKFDYFTPKQGKPGDEIEIHGSRLKKADDGTGVDDLFFKSKGDWTGATFTVVGGVIHTFVPDDAIDGPIALVTNSQCPKILSPKNFDVYPS